MGEPGHDVAESYRVAGELRFAAALLDPNSTEVSVALGLEPSTVNTPTWQPYVRTSFDPKEDEDGR